MNNGGDSRLGGAGGPAGCVRRTRFRGRQFGEAIRIAVRVAGLVARATLLALVLSACGGWRVVSADALARSGTAMPARTADASPAPASASAGAERAPSNPPLTAGGTGTAAAGGGGEGAGGSLQGEADPLVSNGLGSPLCKGVLGEGELPAAGRRDCETSGLVAAAAPTGNYGIDVHIDTGVLGLSSGELLSVVQDLFVTPLWMALVWVVHALVVMLEWCFTIDLLDSAAAGGVARGLRQMQAAFTDPWLAIVLAVASVLALYNGLVRRRVAETLGQALLMVTMMVGGMWVIADPTGTVGALGGWANQASLGTLAVAARGTPGGAGGALAQSMDNVFAAAIEAPWCYLEFGDVGWCRSPVRLDPRLHAAGLKLAAGELALIGCRLGSDPFTSCVAVGSAQAKGLEHSAELLRDAQSNGAIFLALPANGPARNSINEQGSLLRTICQSSEATSCRGPTAAQAEFRTSGGTWSRVGGLLLIVAGVLGMMLLLGFIALRLLAAAIFSLLYLLLAPGMVLAPALGDGGRAVFRRWATQLLGAVVSKLLFSFLLGVVLAVLAILSDLQALGWWTQWLLMSAFWWGAYARRHQALGVAEGAIGRERASSSSTARPRSIARRVSEALDPPRQAIGAARWTMNKLGGQASSVGQRQKRAQARRERARAGSNEQVRRTLAREHSDARAHMEAAPDLQQRLSAKRARLERVHRERERARAGGDDRRAAKLEHRGARIAAEIEREQEALSAARRLAGEGDQAQRRTGRAYTAEQLRERDAFLDAQAALPAAVRAGSLSGVGRRSGERRDYAALAGLAGYGREEYERLDPGAQRAARLEVDRELASRRELGETARSVTASEVTPKLGRRERSKANREFDGELRQRMRDGGQGMPASRGGRSGYDRWRQAGRAEPRPHGARESSVMSDAREVEARRKRQLGRGRP